MNCFNNLGFKLKNERMKKLLPFAVAALIGGASALSMNYFAAKGWNKSLAFGMGFNSGFGNGSGGGSGLGIGNAGGGNGAGGKDVKLVNLMAGQAETSVNFVNAAEITLPTVVHIKTSFTENRVDPGFQQDPFFNLFFGQQPQQHSNKVMAAGSGVIVSQDGYIVTNNHVVENAETIEVTLNDKRTYTATLVGKDPNTDLALLKIKETNLPSIAYGNSDEVKVGEWVLAVGNPFNLTSTVTAGIVSAKGRNLDAMAADPKSGAYPIESYIQTDAAINPGNSGGALVNTAGQLIGINAAIKSNTGSYAGYSFAIPVNLVKKVIADLAEFGEVQRAFLGISIRDLDDKLAKEKHIKSIKGVFVNAVTDGGAAENAGIQEGDVILKIGDVEVNNVPELQEQVGRFRPGDKVSVELKRNDENKTVSMVLRNSKGNTTITKHESSGSVNLLGANFTHPSDEELKRLHLKNGLKISKLTAGKLRDAGVREGFIVTRIDKKDIADAEDLQSALANKEGGVLIEGVYTQNGMRAYYGFGM